MMKTMISMKKIYNIMIKKIIIYNKTNKIKYKIIFKIQGFRLLNNKNNKIIIIMIIKIKTVQIFVALKLEELIIVKF